MYHGYSEDHTKKKSIFPDNFIKKYTFYLDLSENKLVVPSDEEAIQLQSAFKSLKHIVLNGMGCTWKDILTCAAMWPSVTTVSVSF